MSVQLYRALTDGEHRTLLLGDEHPDGRTYCIRRGQRARLLAAGWIEVIDDGSRFGVAVITAAGRAAVRQHGSSGGRA